MAHDVGGLELLRRWATYEELTQRAEDNTRRQHRGAMVRFVADTLLDLRAVGEEDVIAYLETLPRKGGMRDQFLKAAKSFYGWAEPRGYAAHNPVRDFRIKRSPAGPVKVLASEELPRFLDALASQKDARALPTALLMLGTAARIGSVVAARPEDVDLEARRIRWRVAKGNRPYSSPLDPAHSLPAATRLVELAAEGYRLPTGTRQDTLVGAGAETVRKWLRAAGKEAGIPPERSTPHTLRRTMATMMADAGVSLDAWLRVMNHASPDQFLRYKATREDELRRAVGSVDFVGLLDREQRDVVEVGHMAGVGAGGVDRSDLLELRAEALRVDLDPAPARDLAQHDIPF